MTCDLVLNELSISPIALNQADASKRMSDFIKTLIMARKAGTSKVLTEFPTLPQR
jgi:hypothetical protein